MLMPKRVKHRRVHRGRMKGVATKGNTITYGSFGLVAQECGWITSNQIEAARIAMTRYIKRGGKVYIKIFPHKSVTKKPAEVELVPVKGSPSTGIAVMLTGQSDVRNSTEYLKKRQEKQCVSHLINFLSSASL